MSSDQHRRSLSGIWVRPKSQLLLALALCVGFVGIALVLVSLQYSFETFLQDLANSNQIGMQATLALTSHVNFYLRIAVALAAVFALISLIVGIRISHRIYGPMVPIRAHIGHLIRGEFASRVVTRDHDEFPDLVADLNALAESLEKRDQLRNV